MKTPLSSIPAAAWAADLHIHSRFSRATARDLEPGQIAFWAAAKGLGLVGSGDLTHPGWLEELSQRLVPAPFEEGLFILREAKGEEAKVRFLLSGEISCIYKKNQQVRKVHVVVLMPSFEAARKFNAALPASCNLTSDGRPIVGLEAKHILKLVLATDPLAELIPAHIWTPWFSVLGSKSGFDSLAECFEDLSGHIHAAETGLSSDPPMNWRVSSLDRFHLISSSDAHSPANLAREATMFTVGLSYPEIITALRRGEGLAGTLEFFPEEGKYHLDGHRACRVRLEPRQTAAQKGLCPVCGKPVTIGVLNRVEALADRPQGSRPERSRPFESLLTLPQVLGQAWGVGPGSQKVARLYQKLLLDLGSELHILRQAPLEEIARSAGPAAAEGVARVRRGEVQIEGGFDGQFGDIKIFTPEERAELNQQGHLFAASLLKAAFPEPEPAPALPWRGREAALFFEMAADPLTGPRPDVEQEKAVAAPAGPLVVLAGPGSGKTRVLTRRAARLLKDSPVLALTFTRQAAGELSGRLAKLTDSSEITAKASTFHALGLEVLTEWGAGKEVLDQTGQEALLRPLAKKAGLPLRRAADLIAQAKLNPNQEMALCPPDLLARYTAALEAENVYDYEDLLASPLILAGTDPKLASGLAGRFEHVLVDEFQDLNPLQYAWLAFLAPEGGRSLTVVGDPDQSIYGFRGASPVFFKRLASDRPKAAISRLSISYRCPGPILAAAASVISRNPGAHLDLKAARPQGERLRLLACPSPAAEAVAVCQEIERLIGGSSHLALTAGGLDGSNRYTLADIAVLFRLHRQAADLAAALERSGLPYQLAGEEPGREVDDLELGAEKMTLLTFHAAKGLEFPVVFLTGLEDGLLPYTPPGGEIDWAEERRLFYVALTRARDRLVLSRSAKRSVFGQTGRPGPSPFLADIPPELIEEVETGRDRPRKQVQLKLF